MWCPSPVPTTRGCDTRRRTSNPPNKSACKDATAVDPARCKDASGRGHFSLGVSSLPLCDVTLKMGDKSMLA